MNETELATYIIILAISAYAFYLGYKRGMLSCFNNWFKNKEEK